MNQITEQARPRNFGLDFNYALWNANTEVTLANVPWNNDYRDIVSFGVGAAGKAALNKYLDDKPTAETRTVEGLSYSKVNVPIKIDVPFNTANRYNYVRASNPVQPISGDIQKDYYYFVTDVRYVAPNTTEIVIQLDVWQTFGYDTVFGNCYIERGHIGIANENNFDAFGRTFLTIPEGLDVGGEYRMFHKKKIEIMNTWNDNLNVLVASTVNLYSDGGNVDNPILVSANGSQFNGLIAGAEYYLFKSAASFKAYMTFMSDKPWVTQGIISIKMIPKMTRYHDSVTYRADGIPTQAPPNPGKTLTHSMFPNWRDSTDITGIIPTRYRHLKKFMTYPYMLIELTTWGGSPVVLKPECWASADAKVIERSALVPPNERVVFAPQKYNANPGSPVDKIQIDISSTFPGAPLIDYGDGDDNGEYLDITTQIANFPSMALVNNGAIGYMASNANSINYQHRAADWAQTRALGSNETSYDQATSGMNLATDLTGIGRQADAAGTQLSNDTAMSQAVVSGASSVIGGIGGGAAGIAGGVVGAATAGVNMAIQQNQNTQGLAIRSAQANKANAASVGNSAYMRDTNKNLADWSARGDYATSIAGINAKVQDAQLIQPTTSGQTGGEAFNLINSTVELSIRFKMIDDAAIRSVGEYWLRYGYSVRQFKKLPESLHVMSKFTYWKLLETYIKHAPMPEPYKQTIRGIFEKGVTVWVNPEDIGEIDIADNTPLAGITL